MGGNSYRWQQTYTYQLRLAQPLSLSHNPWRQKGWHTPSNFNKPYKAHTTTNRRAHRHHPQGWGTQPLPTGVGDTATAHRGGGHSYCPQELPIQTCQTHAKMCSLLSTTVPCPICTAFLLLLHSEGWVQPLPPTCCLLVWGICSCIPNSWVLWGRESERRQQLQIHSEGRMNSNGKATFWCILSIIPTQRWCHRGSFLRSR